MDEDGFYIGEANGMRGLVPSNFLADAGPVDQTTNVRHVSRVKGGGAEQSLEIGFSNQIFFPKKKNQAKKKKIFFHFGKSEIFFFLSYPSI